MTREQALEKLRAVVRNNSVLISDASIEASLDGYVALGLIKLDSPPTETERLAEFLGWPKGGRSHGELITALAQAGLKLVDIRP